MTKTFNKCKQIVEVCLTRVTKFSTSDVIDYTNTLLYLRPPQSLGIEEFMSPKELEFTGGPPDAGISDESDTYLQKMMCLYFFSFTLLLYSISASRRDVGAVRFIA